MTLEIAKILTVLDTVGCLPSMHSSLLKGSRFYSSISTSPTPQSCDWGVGGGADAALSSSHGKFKASASSKEAHGPAMEKVTGPGQAGTVS